MKAISKWRESSSLILVAKTTFTPLSTNEANYKILSLKRSSQLGFMPDSHVFPGGNVSASDKSRDWLDLYARFGFPQESFSKLDPPRPKPPLLSLENGADQLPQFLALRIGAIRETFEECGVLICRSHKINYKERPAKWASHIGGAEVRHWQERVHADPDVFIELCSRFEVYPDVWALKEWSNWATPAARGKRFDTMFFFAAFQSTPAVHAERQEVQQVEWLSPRELLARSRQKELALPPPQFYEISRLGNFADVDVLLKFAVERAPRGVERFLPVHFKTPDGLYGVLPGDDLYPQRPEDVDSVLEIRDGELETEKRNRVQHLSTYDHRLQVKSYEPKCGHVIPVEIFEGGKL